jgi:SPP1 gp7 family putative phage head morphogenesis protein
MPEPVNLTYAIGLPPEDAINYFRSKGYAFSWNWHEVWQDAHAKSFTVAKAMKLDLLQDIRGAVDKALANGTTLATFRDELEPLLKAKGWWGKDADTGAQLGSGHRLENIFRTNLQSSYMAGRYKQQVENADDRPYWQYIAVMDSRTRPAHSALNGKVFRFDDVFWNTHYPPCGYRCRCRTRAYTEKQVKDKGLTVESGTDNMVWEDKRINKDTTRPVAGYKDPETGKITFTDPGWSSNPGKAAWFPDLDKYDYQVAKKWVENGLQNDSFTAFFNKKIEGNYPVAVLPKDYISLIGAKSQTVYLSTDTLNKQKGLLPGNPGHPELTVAEYMQLPTIIQDANVIVQDSSLSIVFIKLNGRYYQAVVKATKDGETLFLTSFRRVDDIGKEVARLKRKSGAIIIKDDL